MPIVPVAPPQPVPVLSGFDYVTVDAAHRRVYAAHTGSQALLMVDADTGAVIGQVRVGPLHGVAVDPESGHVFTGDGDARSVSEVDPASQKVVRSVDVDGTIDAIAYDPSMHHIYADEDDGTRMFVIDSTTFKQIGVVTLPGHKPEYLAVDPVSHNIYQNIATDAEFVVVDPHSLKVSRTVKTPEITSNHPLQYDPGFQEVIIGGSNGILSGYDRNGQQRWQGAYQKGADQCDLDVTTHRLACAGGGQLSVYALSDGAAPRLLGQLQVARGLHTTAIDPKTHDIWAVWASPDGDHVQRFTVQP